MLNKNNNGQQDGFTLIEIIIGILSAIAIPQFSAYRVRGYNAAALTDIINFKTKLETYYTEWNEYPH